MWDLRLRSTHCVLAGFGLVAGLFGYGLCLARVQGHSMEPTFCPGQWLLVRRLNWPAFPLKDGDVIVLRRSGQTLIKRVAALPGERPPLDDLRVLRFLRPDQVARDPWFAGDVAKMTAPVPEGCLYVLGDNAAVSEDSRAFGPIPGSAVIGRVIRWKIPDPPERLSSGYVPTRGSRTSAQVDAIADARGSGHRESPVNHESNSSLQPQGKDSAASSAREHGSAPLRARPIVAKV
jgi:signal peptidase I